MHSSVLVENVQRTFTRRLFYRARLPKVSYDERLVQLEIPKLQFRHTVTDLTTVYQIMHGWVDLPLEELFQPSYRRSQLRALHPLMIRVPMCRLNLCRSFFSSRVVSAWNRLPSSVVMAPSTQSFRHRLIAHLQETIVSAQMSFPIDRVFPCTFTVYLLMLRHVHSRS